MAQFAAFIPAILSVMGALTAKEGSDEAAQGARTQGDNARVAAARKKTALDFEAQQFDVNAGQELAAAQRVAFEQRRIATLVQSRALAVAAAGGGGASDPSVVRLLANIKGEGAYRSSVALYQGEDRARSLRLMAATKRYEGEVAIEAGENYFEASRIAASAEERKGTAGLISAGGSLFSKYGMGGMGNGGGDVGVGIGGTGGGFDSGSFDFSSAGWA